MKWNKGIVIAVGIGLLIWAGYFVVGLIKSDEAKSITIAELVSEKEEMATILMQTNEEMARFINVRIPKIEELLDSLKINTRRVQKITVQQTIYTDTTTSKIDLPKTVEAIEKGNSIKEPFEEKTDCFLLTGYMEFDGEKLNLVFDDKTYQNEATEIVHVVNRQWRLFGFIKTRLFGKKEIKVHTENECGDTKTYVLIKRKGKWRRK